MERVVSLLPSITEIVCALGFGERLVGRSHECDHPPGVRELPALTEARLDAGAPSRAIDDRVKALVRDGTSVYRVDAERLRELAPDVILTQDQCAVCAASLGDLETALESWIGTRPRVLSLHPTTLGDVWADFVRVADALGDPARGNQLGTELSQRISEVGECTQRIRERPGVVCVEWIDPPMAAGNWMPELVTLAGGRNLLGHTGDGSPWTSLAEIAAADPDALLVCPCGFDLERTRAELEPLWERTEWTELRAVRNGRVYLADGNAFFNRPGPRLVESLEILAEMLHPDLFEPRWRGRAWEIA